MISPESIDLSKLPFELFSNRCHMPKVSAIYFCLDSFDNVLYIGETESLYRRWALQHPKLISCREYGVTKIAYAETPLTTNEKEDKRIRQVIESHFIQEFRPLLNTQLLDVKQRLDALLAGKIPFEKAVVGGSTLQALDSPKQRFDRMVLDLETLTGKVSDLDPVKDSEFIARLLRLIDKKQLWQYRRTAVDQNVVDVWTQLTGVRR